MNKIEADHNGAARRLEKVLSAWLRQITEPPPTWSVLEDALRKIDENYAAEGIHKRESQA